MRMKLISNSNLHEKFTAFLPVHKSGRSQCLENLSFNTTCEWCDPGIYGGGGCSNMPSQEGRDIYYRKAKYVRSPFIRRLKALLFSYMTHFYVHMTGHDKFWLEKCWKDKIHERQDCDICWWFSTSGFSGNSYISSDLSVPLVWYVFFIVWSPWLVPSNFIATT